MPAGHDLPLISTIAYGFSLSFVLGLVATKLRIPPIVGYLLAGILIGPFTPGFVGDMSIAEELSEIGIVLLMFGVGLHFSLKDLLEVKKIALPGALAQIFAATLMGAALAHYAWGWSLQAGLMFGLALSVASTVVLLRTLEEYNLLPTVKGRIAIGWLIVEDLVMILALVMVPVLAEKGDATESLLMALGKISLFIAIMLIGGKRVLPWVLTLVAKTRSRELFTLAVFVAALGIAFGAATLFGVSLALGAFFAGMMIRESDLSHEVAARALPFQDAFAVLFFVSVGMLFNPAILLEHPLSVTATVAIIVIGKSLAAMLIVLLFGYPLKTSLLISASLAQIGEFSFILVALGMTYGLLPEEGQNLILAGAIISIALNPLFFRLSRYAHDYVEKNKRLSSLFNVDETDLSNLRRGEKQALRNLVVIAAHGSIGDYVRGKVSQMNADMVIIDGNLERVETLRKSGLHAVAGEAKEEDTLRKAGVEKALAIVIALPDPFETRHIAETARAINPSIHILLHAHNEEESVHFQQQNVNLAATGAQEVARRMAEYLEPLTR